MFTTNNNNSGTANMKTCALLLNKLANGPWIMDKERKMGEKRSCDYITQKYTDVTRPPALGLIPHQGIMKRTNSLSQVWDQAEVNCDNMLLGYIIMETVNPCIQ